MAGSLQSRFAKFGPRFCEFASIFVVLTGWGISSSQAIAADNLKLNDHLNYQSDSADGPLITGENMSAGLAADKVNYVIIYAEGCYNSKRQARRTVDLYQKYRNRVNFVVVDLDQPASSTQVPLTSKFYKGYIPTVVILDTKGGAIYDRPGEEEETALAALLDKALK